MMHNSTELVKEKVFFDNSVVPTEVGMNQFQFLAWNWSGIGFD
jgi:hypothetical protein